MLTVVSEHIEAVAKKLDPSHMRCEQEGGNAMICITNSFVRRSIGHLGGKWMLHTNKRSLLSMKLRVFSVFLL